MAHIRKLIRDNINTTVTGLDTTAYNVYQSRVYPMHSAKLPGILIYNRSENVQYSTVGVPRLQERIAEFELQIYVKAKTDYDDKLDQICLEVEQALATDVTRGGYAVPVVNAPLPITENDASTKPSTEAVLLTLVTIQLPDHSTLPVVLPVGYKLRVKLAPSTKAN